jgi:peptidoglycan/LPS O-acetylase OafA/YrhL
VKSLPHHHLSLSPWSCGPVCRLGHPEWPHRATGPRSSPRTVGSCGFLSGSSSVGWVSSWPSCPSAELLVQHPGVPRSHGSPQDQVDSYFWDTTLDTGNPRGRASRGHRADSAPLHRPYGRNRWSPMLLQTIGCTSAQIRMAMTNNTQRESLQQNNKLLGLEVVRFISALSVLIWHYQHFYIGKNPADFIRYQQPLYSLFRLFYDYGFYGVQVFWCISGFIFFWKYREAIASKTITYKKFFVLRFSRLYPLHFFTLLLVLALQAIYFAQNNNFFVYQDNDIPHFMYQIFLASNWGFEKGYSFNGPIWSISIEVLVYCFFFFILQNISKSLAVNIAILLICFAAKCFKVSSPIFDCLAFFYIGGISAIAHKHIQTIKYKKTLFYLSIFTLLASPIFIHLTSIYRHKYFATLFLMSYTPILLFVCARHFNFPPAIQKTIEAAGNMTYSSYLIHFPIQLAVAICFLNAEQKIPYYSTVFFIGFIFVTLVLSYYIYRLFELPAQNYIRRKLA